MFEFSFERVLVFSVEIDKSFGFIVLKLVIVFAVSSSWLPRFVIAASFEDAPQAESVIVSKMAVIPKIIFFIFFPPIFLLVSVIWRFLFSKTV